MDYNFPRIKVTKEKEEALTRRSFLGMILPMIGMIAGESLPGFMNASNANKKTSVPMNCGGSCFGSCSEDSSGSCDFGCSGRCGYACSVLALILVDTDVVLDVEDLAKGHLLLNVAMDAHVVKAHVPKLA